MKAKGSLVILIGLFFTFSIGVILYAQMETINPKMMLIYGLIALVAIFSIIVGIKKMKDEKQGQPLEDEFTSKIKHKAGFYAYIASLYMWLILFLLRGFFPDVETLVGGGILLSGVIGYVCKLIVKQEIND